MVIVAPPGPEPEPRTKPILVAVVSRVTGDVSDLHITLALAVQCQGQHTWIMPATSSETSTVLTACVRKGNLVYPNRIQEALAQCWGDFPWHCPPKVLADLCQGGHVWKTATGLQLQHNADLWVVITVPAGLCRGNGDLVAHVLTACVRKGHHHQTTQLISTNDAIQFNSCPGGQCQGMALAICRPLAQIATRIYIVCGTAPTHAGPAAGHEEQVAFVIGAEPDPSTNRHTWWHLKFTAAGVKFAKSWRPLSGMLSTTADNHTCPGPTEARPTAWPHLSSISMPKPRPSRQTSPSALTDTGSQSPGGPLSGTNPAGSTP
jgi:hypothetical protein